MTAGDAVAVMQQWAQDAVSDEGPAAPPLGSRVPAAGAGSAASTDAIDPSAASGVRVTSPGVTGLLVIRADPERVALGEALSGTLGLTLPERLSSSVADGRCLRWMSPDEWLLSCPLEEAFDVETRLRAAVDGFVSITNVSGGYCVLELAGGGVRELLARSTPLDVDPRVFGPARVASTVFAKTTATLRNVDGERYELICRRSFADYVGRWIVGATAPSR